MTIRDLRCDFLSNPLCVGGNHPQLSWTLLSQQPVARQAKVQVQVFEHASFDSPEATLLWDSGRVGSGDPWVIYKGPCRKIGQRVSWRVKAWGDNWESDWSAPASWEWGPLVEEDWRGARWVGACYDDVKRPYPAAFLRRHFQCDGKIGQARLYFSGLGCSEVYLNGSKVDEVLLDPAQSDYERFAYYRAYDVTSFLRQGDNRIGVVLGDGWFNQDRVWTAAVYGDGMSYGNPGVKLLLQIKEKTGKTKPIITDDQWVYTLEGPIRSNNIYAGEHYDARLELGDWTDPVGNGTNLSERRSGVPPLSPQQSKRQDAASTSQTHLKLAPFDPVGQEWKPVRAGDPLSPKLVPQLIPPIRKKRVLPAITVHSPLPGVFVYDFGENLAGICRLRVSAPRGTELCLRFAESLARDGSIDPLSTGYLNTGVVQTDRYTCRGGEEETWEPRFTYHGFRYVELTGCVSPIGADHRGNGRPAQYCQFCRKLWHRHPACVRKTSHGQDAHATYPDSIGRDAPCGELRQLTGHPGTPLVLEAICAYTDLEPAGTFTCSDGLINRLQETALQTITSNLHGVITDCPIRERCGWLGDSHLVAEALIFNFDAANFLRKYQGDILGSLGAANNPCGGYPFDPRVPANIAPGKRRCQQGRPDWAAALILIPWYLYLYYGDTRTMSESFSAMHDLMAYWQEVAKDGVLEDGFGDWCPPGTSPESKTCPAALTSTAYWYQTAGCMRKFASLLGHATETQHYARLQRQIRRVFLDRFFDSADNGFGSQTGDVIALAFGLVPRNRQRDLAQRLARRIREDGKGHFDTGIHGLKHLFDVLAQHGQSDACIELLQQEGFPGFKHLFSLGATTFWEMMYDPECFPLGEERSKNHPMQAAFAAWHFQGLGGLRPDPNRPGFAHFFLRPLLVGNLTRAEMTYQSVRGRIVSNWRIQDGIFLWEVEIPANTSATLRFPEAIIPNSLRGGNRTGDAFQKVPVPTPGGIQLKLCNGCHRFEAAIGAPQHQGWQPKQKH